MPSGFNVTALPPNVTVESLQEELTDIRLREVCTIYNEYFIKPETISVILNADKYCVIKHIKRAFQDAIERVTLYICI